MRSEEPRGRNRSFLSVMVSASVIIIAAFILWKVVVAGRDRMDDVQIITKSRLEKIMNVQELSTFETVYNGIAEVYSKENPQQIDYYVYYESRVKTGIDFSRVEIGVDQEAKKISVQLPEIIITDTNVDITSLDYIFENKRANTPTVSEEAYKACLEDVKRESADESDIYELAEENARKTVRALISPFVEQIDDEYALEIH